MGPLCELLDEFEIPNYSIVDRDDGEPIASGDHITTTDWDFEAEVIDALFAKGSQSTFITFLESEERRKRAVVIKGNSRALKKACATYNVSLMDSEYVFQGEEFEGEFADTPRSRALMYAWLSSNKGVRFDVALAEALGADGIPACYENIIRRAAGL